MVRNSDTIVIECKNHGKSIGRPVIQKLHSAAITYGQGARGLVVSPSGFSADAIEYAQAIQPHQTPVELWDFARLFEVGRSIGVIFTNGLRQQMQIFGPERISDERAGLWLWETYLSKVVSSPRKTHAAFRISRRTRRFTIAAAVVRFQLDRTFDSPSGNRRLHHAHADGQAIHPLNGIVLTTAERTMLTATHHHAIAIERVDQEQLRRLFGPDYERAERLVRSDVAARQSRRIRYQGRNNRNYSMQAEVQTRDVSTNALPVAFERVCVTVDCGPQRHMFIVIGEPANPSISYLASGDADLPALLVGQAVLCNDCGKISSRGRRSGGACSACARTVCREHSHRLPLHPLCQGRLVCSSCVTKLNEASPVEVHWWMAASGVVPGLYWVLRGRPKVAAISAGSLIIAALPLILAKLIPDFWVLGAVVLLSAVEAVFGVKADLRHARLRKKLQDYRPAWR